MALADGNTAARLESFEPRRMYAITPAGAPLQLAATGVAAVESAAAAPDTTNNSRYVTYVTTDGAGFVVPVTGTGVAAVPGTPADPNVPGSGTPGTPATTGTAGTAIALTAPAGSTVSNTDVAAGTTGDQFVAVYQVTSTVPGSPAGPGTPAGPPTVDSDVYAVVYANGSQVTAPFRVNTTTNGDQTDCRVAMDGSGNFVVVWQSTSGGALVGRRFNADGTSSGNEFTISATGVEPDVAESASGTFAVTWATAGSTFAQSYNANGTVSSAAVTVSADGFSEPAIGIANNGRFLVAWARNGGGGGGGGGGTRMIDAQEYNFDGTSRGGAITPASNAALNQNFPEVAFDTSGGFAIGWAQASAGTTYDSSVFRVFNNRGTPSAPETVVSGVQFGADKRIALAYRLPASIHLGYATSAGDAELQTFTNDAAAGNGNGGTGPSGDELPVPAGALLIDLSTTPAGKTVAIGQGGGQITVNVDGTVTNYSSTTYSSIYVRGSDGADYIRLQPTVIESAIVYGRSSNDTVYGGSGNDTIDGGDGDDAIQARAGNDYVYGGAGNDTVFGDTGNDRLLGGPGRNVVYGENNNDTLIGGNRADALIGGQGDDSLSGGDGGDYLDGVRGNDTLDGGAGDDRLIGGGGNDLVVGGVGSDTLYGGALADTLFGSVLDDTTMGGVGNERDIGYVDSLDTASAIRFEVAVK